jgi:hypothetical protein
MKEPKVAKEQALEEFELFADAMDIDTDIDEMNEDEQVEFKKHKGVFIRAMMRGALTLTEKGEAIFTPQRTPDAKPLTFYERTGKMLMEMDGMKKDQDVGKMFRVMGAMTKTSPATIANLTGSDLNTALSIFTLLMA